MGQEDVKLSKTKISYDELLSKVKKIVASRNECKDIHVDSIEVFSQNVNGANWDITRIRRSGDDNDIEECKDAITSEIHSLRTRYDVSK
jgi:arginine/lysine/ornithine decarboxylase